MKFTNEDLLLYAVTDRTWLNGESLATQVEKSLKGGVSILQLREKNLSKEDFLEEAKVIKKLCHEYEVPFIINDSLEVARMCDADGIHVGQDDLRVEYIKDELGSDKIVGVSVKTVEQALLAYNNGADYLGVGAVFTTSTKLDASAVSKDVLKEICEAVPIPVVAIGGINETNALELKGTKIDGIAVVSAIYAKEDILKSTKELHAIASEIVNG